MGLGEIRVSGQRLAVVVDGRGQLVVFGVRAREECLDLRLLGLARNGDRAAQLHDRRIEAAQVPQDASQVSRRNGGRRYRPFLPS